MRAIRLHRRGGSEALVLGHAPPPRAGRGEVLIDVRAAGVTPSELEWAPTWTTKDGGPRPLPVIPGHEFSGIVRAVGPGVTDLAPGDAVYGMNDWFRDGAQAERCVASALGVAAKPRSIDHATAAVTPISALTAWQGLVDRARLEPGERVLVHGGAGAVGSFAVQIARLCGAHVSATVSAHNVALVRRLGADVTIDHRTTHFEEVARELDVVLDTVGGETLERSWRVLRPGGRLVTVAASGEQTTDPRVRDAFFIVQPSRAQLANVARLIDAGDLRALVGAVHDLADARSAYESRPSHGKNVVVIGP